MLLPDLSYLTFAQQEIVLNKPALEPPSNVIPNLGNPPNGNDMAIAITALSLSVSTMLVLVRLYVSWAISKRFYVTDILLILSFGLSVGYYGIVFYHISKIGYLVHQWDADFRDFLFALRYYTIAPTLYSLSIMFIQAALVLEWLRIFNPRCVKNAFYWSSCVVLGTNLVFYPSAIFVLDFACKPFQKFYNPFIKGTCYDPYRLHYASGTVNLVVDVVMLILPQRVIWGLQISAKKKVGLAAVFAFGLLAVVAAGFRLVWTIQFIRSTDVLFRYAAIGLWLTAEMTSLIVVFCIPSIPKATKSMGMPQILSSLRTWKKSTQDADGTGATWPSVDRRQTGARSYQEIDGHNFIPLDTMGSTTRLNPDSSPGLQKQQPEQPALRIIRTTHIVTTSHENISHGTAEIPVNRQHPWVPTFE
ncbi:hypothetical protein HD806DRAFT_538969 [Xylariaceae sp. AK1471]|nr:hypothetical protein HD806DRAFT_538969 [Xylariaceae sp. AK1471]